MQTKNLTAIFFLFLFVYNVSSQNEYSQKLENDICANLIIGSFVCTGCAASDKDLPIDVKQDVNEVLKKFKYCEVRNRDKLAEIVKIGGSEEGISGLNADQRSKLRQYYQAERILFGYLKIQSNGSLLVTIEVNNLTTADQECYKRFTVPAEKYEIYESRQQYIERGISEMLLGSSQSVKNLDIESSSSKSTAKEVSMKSVTNAANLSIKIDNSGGSWAKGGKFRFYLDNEFLGKNIFSPDLNIQKTVTTGSHVLVINDWAGNTGKYTFFVEDPVDYKLMIRALPMFNAESFEFQLIKG